MSTHAPAGRIHSDLCERTLRGTAKYARLLVDHVVFEDVFGGALPSGLSNIVVRKHLPNLPISPPTWRHNQLNRGLFLAFEPVAPRQRPWQRGKPGRDWSVAPGVRELVSRMNLTPFWTQEEARRVVEGYAQGFSGDSESSQAFDGSGAGAGKVLILPSVKEATWAVPPRTRVKRGRGRPPTDPATYRILFADHAYAEDIHTEPLPGSVSDAILRKHRGEKDISQFRKGLEKKGMFISGPGKPVPGRRGKPPSAWSVSELARAMIKRLKANPNLSEADVRLLLSRSNSD